MNLPKVIFIFLFLLINEKVHCTFICLTCSYQEVFIIIILCAFKSFFDLMIFISGNSTFTTKSRLIVAGAIRFTLSRECHFSCFNKYICSFGGRLIDAVFIWF